MTNRSRLLWLYDQMTEHEMTGMQTAVMVVLLARDEAGLAAISKAEIGALVGVRERQVTTILIQLEETLSLIQKERRGGSGKGRAPNVYVIRPDATGRPVPDTWCVPQSSAGYPEPAKISNAQPGAGSQSGSQEPVACGEILPPIKHAPARGNTNLKLRDTSENNLQTPECVSGARVAPWRGGSFGETWTLGEVERTFANEQGFLNGSADALFDRFKDHQLMNGTSRVNWHAAWRKWVRDEVAFHGNKQQRTGRSDNDATYGRAKRNHHTDLLLRDVIDDQPGVVGGLDIISSK